MKAQMPANHRTIISTSDPPRRARALPTTVVAEPRPGLGWPAPQLLQTERTQQPRNLLRGFCLSRRPHFRKKPGCVMMMRPLEEPEPQL